MRTVILLKDIAQLPAAYSPENLEIPEKDFKIICLTPGANGILTEFKGEIEITIFGYFDDNGKIENPLTDKYFKEDYFMFVQKFCFRKEMQKILCLDKRQEEIAKIIASRMKIPIQLSINN